MSEETKCFCPNCGAESTENVGFCGNCGGRLDGEPTEPATNDKTVSIDVSGIVNGASNMAKSATASVKKMPKKKKITIAIAVAVCVALIGLIAGIATYKATYTTIDVKKALDVEFVGLNGGARAEVVPNTMYLTERLAKMMGVDADSMSDLSNFNLNDFDYGNMLSGYSDALRLSMLFETVEIECDPETNLSNGDEVEVRLVYNEDAFKENKIKFKNTEFKVKVKGLVEGTEYDVFKDVKLVYEGISPEVTVSIDYSGCDDFVRNYVDFSIGKKAEFHKNGDVITLTAEYDEETAAENLYVITSTSKEFTVSGQPEYLTDFNGTDASLLKKEMNDNLEAFVSSNYNSGNAYFYGYGYAKSSTAAGLQSSWLLTPKASGGYNEHNIYMCIYKYTVHFEEESIDRYVVVCAEGIVKNADGTLAWEDIDTFAEGDYGTVINKNINSQKADYEVKELKESV